MYGLIQLHALLNSFIVCSTPSSKGKLYLPRGRVICWSDWKYGYKKYENIWMDRALQSK